MNASFKAQIKKVQAKFDRVEDQIVSVVTLQMPAGSTNMHRLIDLCEKWVDVTITDGQIEMWPEKPEKAKVGADPLSVTFDKVR